MGKRKEALLVGEYYHVYNCGPNKSQIFNDSRDFGHFLLLLDHCNDVKNIGHLKDRVNWGDVDSLFTRCQATGSREQLVTIEGYCLLPNHFHLLVRQEVEDGISQFMSRVCGGYSRKYNVKHQTFGTRFQGKFQARHVDSQEYLYQLLAYVPANYLVHDMRHTKDYRSSLANAFDAQNCFITQSNLIRQEFETLDQYLRWAVPRIQETRRKRSEESLFDE